MINHHLKKKCSKCGETRKFVGYRSKKVISLLGKIEIKRTYFHCTKCKKGSCPSDKSWQFLPFNVSPKVAEKICLMASLESYERSSDLLYRLSNISIQATHLEDIAKKVGRTLVLAERAERIQKEKSKVKQNISSERLYLQADGAMVNTSEGWKENKLALAFAEKDMKKTGYGENERVSIKKKDFASSLGEGVETFKSLVWKLLERVNCTTQSELIIVTDGAQWLMNIATELKKKFTNVVHILDWFHVTENLWKCANALMGEGTEQAKGWVEKYKEIIWQGEINTVLTMLLNEIKITKKQTPLRDLYNYFYSRKESMRYNVFRDKGYYIGSGAIESANKYAIQSRLKKAGMKWSIDGANAIAHLKIGYLANRWDTFWEKNGIIATNLAS